MSGTAVPASADQRAYPRVPLVLPGVLAMPERELACTVVNISLSGAGLQYLQDAPAGLLAARLVIQDFGCFEGTTNRDRGDCRGLRFQPGEAERNKLVTRLTLYIEKGLADAGADERSDAARLSLTGLNGAREDCEVRRISLRGVSLLTRQRPPVGEMVRLGRMYGRVAGHRSGGIDVRFLSFV